MITDRLASATTDWLSRQSSVFKEAFAWLRAMPASTPDGVIELRGRQLYAEVQSVATKPEAERRWESHRRMIDIQYIFEGGEVIDYTRAGILEPNNDYDPVREVEFWQPTAPPTAALRLAPGDYVVFLTNEPHRPKGQDGMHGTVRKVVVKIDSSLIS
jgi:YhcH/YjgK/YiaL family protein